MAFDQHTNFAYSTVAVAPVTPTAGTALTVQTGDGAKFPTPPFNAVVWPVGAQPLSTNAEIVRVTAIVSDVLTITRTQEGTSARSIVATDQIDAAITVKIATDIETATTLAVIGPLIYPVGSYYFNETNSTNPGTLFGFGTWTAVTDAFLVGHGSTYTATGGSASHSHSLSDSGQALIRMSTSSPFFRMRRVSTSSWTATLSSTVNPTVGVDSNTDTSGAALTGNTDSTTQVPPYQAVYVWKRTA